MWLVYIIFSKKIKKTYIGSTNNFGKRLIEHNSNKVYSTKYKGPWIPIRIEFYPNEISARERERYLKSSSGRRYLKKTIDNIVKQWLGSSVG